MKQSYIDLKVKNDVIIKDSTYFKGQKEQIEQEYKSDYMALMNLM